METKTLIDKAAKKVQSKTELARVLGVTPQRISEWAHGHRPCPLEVQVRLCAIAELVDDETLEHVREVARVPSPKPKAGVLASIALAVVGVVVSVAAFISDAHASSLEPMRHDVYYVNS